MRIYGNRSLKTLAGNDVRPTLARVREAVFNIWQLRVEGCRWLDLCAGTGSMGAEALGRGAALAVAIERSNRASAIIQQNWQKIAQPDQTFQIIRGDIRQRLKSLQGQTFDLIYFDPPYASGLYEPVLTEIYQYQLLAPEGELAVEYDPKQWYPEPRQDLTPIRTKTYGNTALAFYHL